MGSKAIVFLGLFLATALLISSEVAARDLAETSNTPLPGLPPAYKTGPPYPNGNCRNGCCGGSSYTGSCRCCTFAGEKADADLQAKPHN
ncbi:hypothetical protein BUALT_Bualt14G0027900 [Buddleja alternifolia]|uniref:Uncharacterized protein n=1 Tax=Buddleja alternifolia TaxID=168488 RepID=A0AAV6WRN5_9LAMI|nr:hypothetical protein BUALT_Bualt14G0027900 [Buddleja alternifolia]